MLLQLCVDAYYVAPGQAHRDLFQRGMCCHYGPLGVELKKHLLEQWWGSVQRSRTQMFGISTLTTTTTNDDQSGVGHPILDDERLKHLLDAEHINKVQLVQRIQTLLQQSTPLRANLLQGALGHYGTWLELVNRRLPFGLTETGLCVQPSDGSGSQGEATYASLVWFCSPRSSSQWLDHWTRLRLQWWRKFALAPSEFSSQDVPEEALPGGVSRGVKIVYSFPWGQETLENLWSRGDSELLQTHGGVRAKIQCRDGRKLVVPHVVSVASNMDRGMMAYLHNSLQLLKKDSKQKLHQRKVLKLHPVLAPVKVALVTGKGATLELRQVCEGLLQEFLEAGISAWPGYTDTSSSMEQLNTKYDGMGILFTMVIDENTLESGLLQVRSRDTTVRELKHISEAKGFLLRYIRAAHNM